MNDPHPTLPNNSVNHDPHIRRLEVVISNLLRVGVITSVALIVTGTIATFIQHPVYLSSPAELERIVAPNAIFPHASSVLFAELRQLRGEAIVTLGLLVLMATPVMRVAVSIVGFVHQRDRIYIVITATVLCLLLLSLVLGRVE